MYSRQFAFNSRHGFVLSALTLALMSATGASFAGTAITVNSGNTHTDDIIATDATTTLTVKNGGTVQNNKIVMKGGALNLEAGSKVYTDEFEVLVNRAIS